MSRARFTAQSFRRSMAISRMSLGRSSDQEDGTATETVPAARRLIYIGYEITISGYEITISY